MKNKILMFLLVISVSLGAANFKQRLEYNKLVKENEKIQKEFSKLKLLNQQYLDQMKLCEKERLYHAAEAEKHQATVDQLTSEYEELKQLKDTRVEVITKEIERVVEKPIYQNECLDQEGIDLLNEINSKVQK